MAALIACLLSACTANIRDVTGEPPQASIDGIERRGSTLLVELALANVNDEPMRLVAVDLNLEVDGVALTRGQRNVPVVISANGREVLRLSLEAERAGLARLDRLAGGEVPRLPWTLSLELGIVEGPDRQTRTEGWLHPVPGQAHRFR